MTLLFTVKQGDAYSLQTQNCRHCSLQRIPTSVPETSVHTSLLLIVSSSLGYSHCFVASLLAHLCTVSLRSILIFSSVRPAFLQYLIPLSCQSILVPKLNCSSASSSFKSFANTSLAPTIAEGEPRVMYLSRYTVSSVYRRLID